MEEVESGVTTFKLYTIIFDWGTGNFHFYRHSLVWAEMTISTLASRIAAKYDTVPTFFFTGHYSANTAFALNYDYKSAFFMPWNTGTNNHCQYSYVTDEDALFAPIQFFESIPTLSHSTQTGVLTLIDQTIYSSAPNLESFTSEDVSTFFVINDFTPYLTQICPSYALDDGATLTLYYDEDTTQVDYGVTLVSCDLCEGSSVLFGDFDSGGQIDVSTYASITSDMCVDITTPGPTMDISIYNIGLNDIGLYKLGV